jgi:hypothetical protein
MKLIIREYLASLRERGELDAVLPDLLSQMGLNVYSRPGRGTRQDGVDVGAVGELNGGGDKVYLFTIKPGDLTRSSWDGEVQSVRPSLNEILDAYIPNRLPSEHRDKDVVICICCGGDIQEPVRPQLEGFVQKNTKGKVSFEEWNGDKLASYIQTNFLREDLLPKEARSHLRKSLAMLDEPDTSYKHFSALVTSLSEVDTLTDSQRVTAIRQIGICLWILFVWSRDAGNMEAAYRSSELAMLHGWKIVALYAERATKAAQAVQTAFFSIFSAYQQICTEFLRVNVMPHVGKLHALSSAVRGSCSLDVNLKLFDLLGRTATDGIWAYWGATRCPDGQAEQKDKMLDEMRMYASAVKCLVSNNPALLLPIKDDQAIDISIALSLLAIDPNNRQDIRNWLTEMLERAGFSYIVHGRYPCNLDSYADLLVHPKVGDDEYRRNVTAGSILYPMIALWAALLDDEELYDNVALLKSKHLEHCNFQFWYPDDSSEEHFYTNSNTHGAALSRVTVDRPREEFLEQVFGECEQSSQFKDLTAVKFDWWPLVVVACRHYRLPLPLHLIQGLRKKRTPKIEANSDDILNNETAGRTSRS